MRPRVPSAVEALIVGRAVCWTPDLTFRLCTGDVQASGEAPYVWPRGVGRRRSTAGSTLAAVRHMFFRVQGSHVLRSTVSPLDSEGLREPPRPSGDCSPADADCYQNHRQRAS